MIQANKTPARGVTTSGMTAADLSAIKPLTLPEGAHFTPNGLTTRDVTIEDPMNMHAVDQVIARAVHDTRATMAPDGILYVAIGESHNIPNNVMALPGLVDNLMAPPADENTYDPRGKIKVALEEPYNTLQFYMRLAYGFDLSEPEKSHLHDHDPLNHHSLRAVMDKNKIICAPQSVTQRFSRPLRHNIPVILADAGRKDDWGFLSPDDPLASEIAKKHFGRNLKTEHVTLSPKNGDPDGVNIRNEVMAQRIIAAAKDGNTMIINTGAAHVAGDSIYKGITYSKALVPCLNSKIRPQDHLLSLIFLDSSWPPEYKIDPQMWRDHPDSIIIRGMTENKYDTGQIFATFTERRHLSKLGQSYARAGLAVPDRFVPVTPPDEATVTAELIALRDRAEAHLDAAL
jgi:hypothetical protein